MPTSTKPKRTISPEQKMKMAISGARAAAKEMGMPDPSPNYDGKDVRTAMPASPANAPALTQPPAASAPLQPTLPPEPTVSAPIQTNAPSAKVSAAMPQGEVKEPPRFGPQDIVRVFNPDNEDFHFRFGTKVQYDGKGHAIKSTIEPIMYTLEAGKARPRHGYMADYVCRHLRSRILQKRGQVRQMNSPIVTKAWAAKIILGKEDLITPERKLSEAEQVQAEYAKIQDKAAEANTGTDDLDDLPLADADALLDDIDQETAKENGGEFPDANPDLTA